MTITTLLLGLLIATFVFASFGWSIARSFQTTGRTCHSHAALAICILLAMACLSLNWPLATRLAGALLVLAAIAAVLAEQGWSRLLPAVGMGFGLVLFAGLPFSG